MNYLTFSKPPQMCLRRTWSQTAAKSNVKIIFLKKKQLKELKASFHLFVKHCLKRFTNLCSKGIRYTLVNSLKNYKYTITLCLFDFNVSF